MLFARVRTRELQKIGCQPCQAVDLFEITFQYRFVLFGPVRFEQRDLGIAFEYRQRSANLV